MLACVRQYCRTAGLVLACAQQYCRMADLMLAYVQQYCRTAGLVLACVQQDIVENCLMFISIWTCSGLCSIVTLLVLACVQQYV